MVAGALAPIPSVEDEPIARMSSVLSAPLSSFDSPAPFASNADAKAGQLEQRARANVEIETIAPVHARPVRAAAARLNERPRGWL